ncbi:MAG: hypothetical protein Q7O66_07305 [Dehalococcoidia bacterium]|nr:hypothetical protein [Dehalococcoidia bacterium]
MVIIGGGLTPDMGADLDEVWLRVLKGAGCIDGQGVVVTEGLKNALIGLGYALARADNLLSLECKAILVSTDAEIMSEIMGANLSTRTRNALRRAYFLYVGIMPRKLLSQLTPSEFETAKPRGLGVAARTEILAKFPNLRDEDGDLGNYR